MLKIFERVVNEKVSAYMTGLNLREMVISSIVPSLKDSMDKVLWEMAPEMGEKVLKGVLKESVSSLSKEIEKVIWETVPDLASTMISKEIEKIKADF